MWTPAAFLLLWGVTLGPGHAAVVQETRPILWAEPQSLEDPGANLTLVCQARLWTADFQLLRDGEALPPVHLDFPAQELRFPLGAVNTTTRGLYRCRSGQGEGWTGLSDLLEVTEPGSLPAPQLSADRTWAAPGLPASLLCGAGLRGLSFELRREGDSAVLEVARDPRALDATFPVLRGGNYSCSFRTHAGGAPSPPSAPLQVLQLAAPPAPELLVRGERAAVLRTGEAAHLDCSLPLHGVDTELRRAGQELQVSRSGVPGRITFHLGPETRSGLYTCRYRHRAEGSPWSSDSEAVELLLSDGSLPAPALSVEHVLGRLLRLRCAGSRPGLRFALLRGARVLRLLSPQGAEAVFELRGVSAADAGNYSCVSAEPQPPFAGSEPSAAWELLSSEPPPKPRLRGLWSGPVLPGHDALLLCEAPVPRVHLELLRAGAEDGDRDHEPDHDQHQDPAAQSWGQHGSAHLRLTFVGPQHAGNYTCRYRTWGPGALLSAPSDPVQLQVAGR